MSSLHTKDCVSLRVCLYVVWFFCQSVIPAGLCVCLLFCLFVGLAFTSLLQTVCPCYNWIDVVTTPLRGFKYLTKNYYENCFDFQKVQIKIACQKIEEHVLYVFFLVSYIKVCLTYVYLSAFVDVIYTHLYVHSPASLSIYIGIFFLVFNEIFFLSLTF